MTNPHSRDRRNVHPKNLRPAILQNYDIHFSPAGFATVCPTDGKGSSDSDSTGSGVHGVLMEFDSQEEWDVILKVETAYTLRREKVVETQSGELVEANVFCLEQQQNLEEEGKPQERYLKIIAQGLEHHGVDPNYIQKLFQFEYRPSRKPDNYLSFPTEPNNLPTISFQDYVKRSRVQPCFLIHDRVIDLVGEYDPASPLIKIFCEHHAGKDDCTPRVIKAVYDPDLPETDQWKWAENHIVDMVTSMGMDDNFRVTYQLLKPE